MTSTHIPFVRCSGDRCPSKMNCHRTGSYHVGTTAALHARREAGASACDQFMPIKVITTFKEL